MCNEIGGGNPVVCCGVLSFLTVSAITLLVVGILGAQSIVSISPPGPQFMIVLGIAIFVG